jgi:FG-GAP-like repeat
MLAVDDLNQDGLHDVVGASSGGALSIMLNAGGGRLVAATSFPAGFGSFSTPFAIEAAALNTDTFPDLLVGAGQAEWQGAAPPVNGLAVLLGRAGNRFEQAGIYGLPHAPDGIAVADLNGDGLVDAAVATQANDVNNVTVLFGNGDGSFVSHQNISVANFPERVAATDVTGDGVPDLVLAITNTGTGKAEVKVLPGLGGGSFGSAITTSLPRGEASDLAVSDLDHDGNQDAIVAVDGTSVGTPSQVIVALGRGDGTFSLKGSYAVGSPARFVYPDVNGDGQLDLAVVSPDKRSVTVLLGNGDGTFSEPVRSDADFRMQAITTGDYNGDSIPDLAASEQSGVVVLMIGKGDGRLRLATRFFLEATAAGQTLLTSDLDTDGRSDVAAVTWAGATTMLQR